MTIKVFEVQAEKLLSYDPKQGIDLIKRLLWAEAWRLGIPRHAVNISGEITVADGGIDAAVETSGIHESILITGRSHYQIKTGPSFKPWQQAEIKKELFGDKAPGPEALGEQTLKGLHDGLAYSLITLGHDLTTEQKDKAKSWLAEYFSTCGFKNVQVHVLGAGEIAGILGLHPSLCLDINGLGDVRFQTVGSWKADADMTPQLSLGALQSQFVDQLRGILEAAEVQHVRIVGEPGIGKTRLVLEAISGRENLSASTMYFRQASDFQGTVFFNDLMREGQARSSIIVIDECEDAERTQIWAALKGRKGIKLVTIDHGPGSSSGSGMETLNAPLLEQEQIESILRGYLPGNQILHNWAMWCDGSARVAHALGENLRDHPEDIFRSPDTVQIWDRFISGYGNAVDGDRARTVLMHIALFEMFGYLPPVQEEADFISSLVQKTDPSITRPKFDQIVQYYLQRRILQGDRTLRIVPRALRIYLWREWWKNFGASANILELLNTMPESLHRWFKHSFVYAKDVKHALSVVKTLLDPTSGLFPDKASIVSEVGAGFISVLAQAAPAEALALLRGILQWTDEELHETLSERHALARTLSMIAVWQPHFRTAAKILARLSFGESTRYSNNCRGTLKGLFVPFNAPTQAPFSERVQLALEMLSDKSEFTRELGLSLCSSTLRVRGGSRIIDVEFQGALPEIIFWHPQLWTDLTEPWEKVINSLLKSRASTDHLWNSKIDHAIIEGIGELIRTNVLLDLSVKTLAELSKERRNFHQVYQLLTHIVRYTPEHLSKEVIAQLTELKLNMDGSDFHSRLLRHVLSAIWDDDIEEAADGGMERRAAIIKSLAKEASSDVDLLRSALPELYASDVVILGSQFGEFLATELADDRFDQEMLSYLFSHIEKCSHPFLGGYLRGVFRLDASRWESLALTLLAQPTRLILIAVVDSGTSSAVFERLLQIHNESSEDSSWISLLAHSSIAPMLGKERIRRAIQAVIEKSGSKYEIAIQMADWTLCKTDDDLDIPSAMAVLVAGAGQDVSTMGDYYWGSLATRLLERAPQCKIELFRLMVEGTISFGGITSGGKMSSVAYKICKEEPHLTWPIVANALSSDRGYLFMMWLSDDSIRAEPHPPAITAFNPSDIFAWIDEARLVRAPQIPQALPKTLDLERGGQLTRDFLERYVDIEGIGHAVMAYFGTGSYSGPRSHHLANRRTKAQQWMAQVGPGIVGDWLEDYVQKLSKEIETEKIREERSM